MPEFSNQHPDSAGISVDPDRWRRFFRPLHGYQAARSRHERFLLIEKSDDIGGTWYDNRYRGCACDVPSHLYSFSFEPNADWSRMFANRPEIHRYLKSCVQRYGLAPYIRLNTHESLVVGHNSPFVRVRTLCENTYDEAP